MVKMIIAHHNLNERGGAERVVMRIAQHYDAKIYTFGYDKDATFKEFADLDVEVIGRKPKINAVLSGAHLQCGLLRAAASTTPR